MRVGILGGSFNPAHQGHLHISLEAMKRMQLQRILWVVARQSPHKDQNTLAPFADRFQKAQKIAADIPNIIVSDIEKQQKLTYSIETIRLFLRHYPHVHFVWLLGADLMRGFHLWKEWVALTRALPIACLPRPQHRLSARSSKAAQRLRSFEIDPSDAPLLAHRTPPALLFLDAPTHPLSASEIRKRGTPI